MCSKVSSISHQRALYATCVTRPLEEIGFSWLPVVLAERQEIQSTEEGELIRMGTT